METLNELNHLGIEFISLRENIDTGGPLGRAIVVIIGAIAELEKSLIVERVRAGIRRAKLEGRRIGRAPLNIDRSQVVADRRSGMSLSEVARKHRISRAIVCRLVNEFGRDEKPGLPRVSVQVEQFPLLKQAICRRPPRLRRQPYPTIELRHRIERRDLSKLVERDFGGSSFVNLWLSECIITYGGKEIRTATVDGNLLAPEELNVSLRAHPSQPDIQLILDSNPPLMELRLGEYLKGTQVEPTSQFNLRDPQALRLVQALECDMDQGCPAGTVFAERIGGALSVYLAHRSERNSPNSGVVAGGVASRRFTRVLEYIRANLDHDIHIDELADAAGLSMFHFAKLFKRSTGCSPHQYILHRRLERATELLRNTQLSLSEIALRAGFADQSHLTNVFRRINGVTPSRFRAQI